MVSQGPVTQAEFAYDVGISQQAVSDLVQAGVLLKGATEAEWLHAYCARLREQAAGRQSSEVGGLDLVQERAALAREQRMGLEIKNAVARGEWASIALLGEVLARASQAVAERMDHLAGVLRKTCPEMTDAQRDQVLAVVASARNEWVRSTTELVVAGLDVAGADDEPELFETDDADGRA